jgi:hypothetical protein
MPATIDSNKTNLTYAEEASLKVLPTTPVWYPLEPNTYASFGGDLKTTPREPINASRQRAKGTVTDLDVSAGFNLDFVQNQITRLLQGFFFSTAREKFATQPLNGTQVPVTSVLATSGPTIQNFNAANGLTPLVGAIVKSEGFGKNANNTLSRVTISTAAKVTAVSHLANKPAHALVDEPAPPSTARLRVVGFALSGDVKLYGPGSTFGGGPVIQPFLSSATLNFTTLGLIPGEWVYLGDSTDSLADTGATEFNFIGTGNVRCRGFCRIGSITATQLTFDISIGSDAWALSGTGDGSIAIGASAYVSLFFGTVIRNEPAVADIIRRTYTLQRYLGKGVGNQDNLESVSGAIPDQFTLNMASNSKLDCDMSFVAMDTAQQYTASLPGTYSALSRETAYNTSQDVYAMLLYIINTAATTQAPLFGYATDEKLTINNNASVNKAIGVVGGFEGTVGNFDVSGTLTCYFDDIAAQQAVRNNADVGLTNIFAKQNEGFLIDLPLLTLGLNGLKVEKDKPIMADITQTASPGAQNYTALYNKFHYLPDSAMANYKG